MIKFNKSFFVKRILPIIAGGILGYTYYYFIGCNNGSCAISSSPYISTVYGFVAGFIFTIPNSKKKENKN
jgi:membrane protein DedA with SNARE-associated domain